MKLLSLKNRKNRLNQTMIFLAGFSLINLSSYNLEAEDKSKIEEKYDIKSMKERCQKKDWLSCSYLSQYYKKTNKTLSGSFLKQAKNALKKTLTNQKKACLENGNSCYDFLNTYYYYYHSYEIERELKKYILNSIKKDFQKEIFWEKMKTACSKHPIDFYEFLTFGYPEIKHVIIALNIVE